jgi:hypothetical protein
VLITVSLAVAVSLTLLTNTIAELTVSDVLANSLIDTFAVNPAENISVTLAVSAMFPTIAACAATFTESLATIKPPLPKPHPPNESSAPPQMPLPQPPLEMTG